MNESKYPRKSTDSPINSTCKMLSHHRLLECDKQVSCFLASIYTLQGDYNYIRPLKLQWLLHT